MPCGEQNTVLGDTRSVLSQHQTSCESGEVKRNTVQLGEQLVWRDGLKSMSVDKCQGKTAVIWVVSLCVVFQCRRPWLLSGYRRRGTASSAGTTPTPPSRPSRQSGTWRRSCSSRYVRLFVCLYLHFFVWFIGSFFHFFVRPIHSGVCVRSELGNRIATGKCGNSSTQFSTNSISWPVWIGLKLTHT